MVPTAGLLNIGFAFSSSEQIYPALDSSLGKYIQRQIEKAGLQTASPRWANGFREVMSSSKPVRTPDYLAGFKIRVFASPILTSLFQALGAGPTPINCNELYSALQTKLVDGEENPPPIIATAKLNEVQQYRSMTNHFWDGYWTLSNRRAFQRLPTDIQEIVTREFTRSGQDERADIVQLTNTLTRYGPAISSLIRLASASIANGFVSTCIPGSRCPWLSTAFSA